MRVFVAGLLGGIVFFLWGAFAHMALPIGEMGMKVPTAQDGALTAVQGSTQGAGIYMYPSMDMADWSDEAKKNAFVEANKGKAYAFVVYDPAGNPAMADMGPNLIKQFGSDLLSAFVVAFVLALGAFGFAKRVLVSGLLGLFSWLTVSVPYWNWYHFPMDFTIGNLLEQVVGWLIAGAAMAWWLGRKGQ